MLILPQRKAVKDFHLYRSPPKGKKEKANRNLNRDLCNVRIILSIRLLEKLNPLKRKIKKISIRFKIIIKKINMSLKKMRKKAQII